jgi:hypothetical protein
MPFFLTNSRNVIISEDNVIPTEVLPLISKPSGSILTEISLTFLFSGKGKPTNTVFIKLNIQRPIDVNVHKNGDGARI